MENFIGKIASPFNQEESIDFVRLTLSNDIIEIEFSSSVHNSNNVSTIFGIFNGLGNITLVNCQNIGKSMGAGADVRKYSAQYLFKGEFIDNPSDFYFNRVIIQMSGLLDWTKMRSIKDELFTDKKLTIEQIENDKIYNSEKFSIEIVSSQIINSKRENNQVTVKENAGLRIKSNNGLINIWEFLNLIKELKKILFILSNKNNNIDSTTFYTEKDLPVYLFWNGNNSFGSPSPMNPSIKYEDIKSGLKNIFDIWFNNKDIHTSIDLILEKSINNQLSRENYFLNNCFSIETYHRRFKNYNLFDKKEFAKVKSKILKTIEKEELMKLIENNLAHLNQPNFKARLLDFESDFYKILPKEWDTLEFIRKIVKTRNFLVHRSSEKHIFNKFDMLYASIFLETIVKINIFRTLEIEDFILSDLLEKTGEKIKGFYDANKRLNFDK